MELLTNLQLSILSITIIVNLLFAFVVYKNNSRSATNAFFSLLSIVTSVWLVINYLALHPNFSQYFLWLARLSPFLGVAQVTLFYLLAYNLPHSELKIPRKRLYTLVGVALGIMLLTISPFTFTGVSESNGAKSPIPGPGLVPFALFATFLSIAAIYTLIRRIKTSPGVEKQQLRFVMAGILLMLGLIIFAILIPAGFFKNTSFIPFSPLFALTFLGMTTFAIVKHRLLDIRSVVARTVAYSLLITIIGFFYAGAALFLGAKFFGASVSSLSLLFYIVLTIIIALSYDRLKHVLEKATDKVFFKGNYDSNQLLSSLAHVMSTTIELRPLATGILEILLREMRVSRGAFALFGRETLYEFISQGFENPSKYTFTELMPLMVEKEVLIFDELEESPLKQHMRDFNISLVKLLKVKSDVVGLIVLGEKASGELYTDQDIKILDILGPEIAIAIQNAESFDKIKKFNVTLTQEVQRATKDLQVANVKLKELDKLKDDFVSIASHELRTPMTAIRSYAWMALNRPDVPLSERMKKYLSRTLISTERLINLVNDMLNISRIESGRIEITPQAFDIDQLVNDVFGEVSAKAKEKDLHLYLHRIAIPKVFADPDKVHQVLLNLIGNAMKFTPQHGRIDLSFFTDGEVVEVVVKDSGVGISKEDISRLFKKFGRLDNSYVAAATSGGTGLGLYICKSLIDLMKGRIWVQSEGVNKGTSFIFTLPVANAKVVAQSHLYTRKAEGEVKQLEPVGL